MHYSKFSSTLQVLLPQKRKTGVKKFPRPCIIRWGRGYNDSRYGTGCFPLDDGVCVSSTRWKENTTLWGRAHCRSTLPLPSCRISGRCSASRTWVTKNGKPFFNGPDVPPRRRICGCWSGRSHPGSTRPSMTEHFPDVCGPGRGFPLPGLFALRWPFATHGVACMEFQDTRGRFCVVTRHAPCQKPKYVRALRQQISCTIWPRVSRSSGYSPSSTQRPSRSHKMRRKYSCRG